MRILYRSFLVAIAAVALVFGQAAKNTEKDTPVPVKPILFWTALGVAGAGAGLNVWAFLDNGAVLTAKNTYDNAVDNHDMLFSQYLGLANGMNTKYIIAGICYFVSAGLFLQWMATPDTPLYSVTPSFSADTVAMNFSARF